LITEGRAQQQPQQIGMPFIIMQQVQPAFIMPMQQSQQAWIMAQQSMSPLVQVMQTPISVASHLHMPIIMLQQQAIMPFIIMQQEHIPPAVIVQRFWSMPAVTLSSQTQVTFMPPAHFSNVMVQRGTIIMFMPAGIVPGVPIIPAGPVIPMPGMPIPARSIIIAVVILVFSSVRSFSGRTSSGPPSNALHSDRRPIAPQEKKQKYIRKRS
jgi:hypothetical protein